MNIRPLGDRVVLQVLESEERTKSGIVLPDTAKEKPQMGKVLAVGEGRLLENGMKHALDVQVGDKVLFTKYAGTEIKLDGEEYMIMKEIDILGIVAG
ncbi:MAG TPA: co-chaperone GroES [Bacillota bacterium]